MVVFYEVKPDNSPACLGAYIKKFLAAGEIADKVVAGPSGYDPYRGMVKAGNPVCRLI